MNTNRNITMTRKTKSKAGVPKEEILVLRSTGMSKLNIAIELEINISWVNSVLKDHDPNPHKKTRVKQILELYDQGLTYEEIAETLDVTKGYVQSQISTHAQSFQPLGRLNNHTSDMTHDERKRRQHLMFEFLKEKGADSVWVTVMRDNKYKIEARNVACARKLRDVFKNGEIIHTSKRYIIVTKIF